MSFVLAVAFVLSIGTNSWAYTHRGSTGGGTITVGMSDIYDQYGTGEQKRTGGNGDNGLVDGAKAETNRICAVFNYASGIVLSAMDQDRNLTLYSAGAAFLSLTYNEATGDKGFGYFTLVSVNISGSDWINIQKAGGLKSWLKKLGASDSMLSHAEQTFGKDKEGNQTISVDKSKTKEVGWLADAEEQLSMGVNHSISINFTASGGASVTMITNGKQMETLGYDWGQYGDASKSPLAVYNYNAAGTLESITQKTYKTDEKNTNLGDKQGDGTRSFDSATYYVAYTEVHMDEYGRQSFATDTNGNVVTTYTYSTTGSIAAIHDLTTNNTTWYAAGHASFVLNDSGFKTTEYYYHENGSLDWVCSFNYDEDKGGVYATQGSAYRYGKFIGSANLADLVTNKAGNIIQANNGDEIRAAVDFMKLHPDKWQESLEKGAKANLKDSDIKMTIEIDGKNETFTWNGSGWIDSKGNQVTDDIAAAKDKNKKQWLANNPDATEDDWKNAKQSQNSYYRKIAAGTYQQLVAKGEELMKKAVTNSSKYANITAVGIYANDLKNNAFLTTYKAMFCSTPSAVKAFDTALADMVRLSNGSSMLGQISLTIDAKAFDTIPDNQTKNKVKTEGGHFDAYTTSETSSKVTQVGKVGQQISSKLTIMDHGIQCYQINLDAYTLREAQDQIIRNTTTNTTHVDPVVTGNLVTGDELEKIADTLRTKDNDVKVEDGVIIVTDKDGNVTKYAAVKGGKINMMEGSGFQSMEGESMLVDITSLSDDQISEMKSAGKVMFMGDVDYTASGKLAIKLNTEYGDGYKFGSSKEIDDEMDRIEKVANGEEPAGPKDGWIKENTDYNISKLGKKWMEQQSGSMKDKLEEAWGILKPNF